MKRRQLVRHILEQGCFLVREGARHSVYCNPSTGNTSAVPRHTEVNDYLARKICRDLGISPPS
ncbi:MAG TPA: type II toxin-antitoxin system HicA family toxin [Verrucomicrobiae bacterium]|nr:type II toxin-antitoxin system HicA family toxin [Verrucomicrobiae bacterium]